MTQSFRWSVCILDDQPGHPDVKDIETVLKRAEFVVYSYGGSDYSFLSPKAKTLGIVDSHFFFVDMQWDPTASSGGFLCATPRFDSAMHSGQMETELESFAAGLARRPEIKPGGTRPEPNPDLPYNSLGVWIACAVSYLNPAGKLYFYSGHDELQRDKLTSVLLKFQSPPVRLLPKSERHTIMEFIETDLQSWQRQVFEYSDEAYQWFVGKVLLQVMLGQNPAPALVGQLYPSDAVGKWQLKAELFFPQWDQWSEGGNRIDHLAKYLRRRNFQRPEHERMSLSETRHIVAYCQEEFQKGRKSKELELEMDRAIKKSYGAGLSGERIRPELEAARNHLTRATLETAARACYRASSNTLADLYEYCAEIRKRFGESNSRYECGDLAVKPVWKSTGDTASIPTEPPAPFDVSHLRHACDALEINGKKNLPKGVLFSCSLHVLDDGEFLAIEFEDNSIGFATEAEFVAKVLESLTKRRGSIDDGLPLVLTFGAFYSLDKLSVKLNTGQWVQLFPRKVCSGAVSAAGGFGVRWLFQFGK